MILPISFLLGGVNLLLLLAFFFGVIARNCSVLGFLKHRLLLATELEYKQAKRYPAMETEKQLQCPKCSTPLFTSGSILLPEMPE